MEKVTSWKELTLREKIGQTVICLCETEKHIEMCGSIEKFLEKYPVGGVFNNGGIVKGLMVDEKPDLKNIVKEYNKHLRVPLITTADHGSYASKLGMQLPPQMAFGAADDENLAYEAGLFKAEDYKETGINWGFWPVCDLNMSDRSPVTDVRSVSDDWRLSAKIVKQEIKAMKERGVVATIKHYPGTSYNESVDAHLAPVNNETPIDLWRETYGKMYKELIEAGVPTIMTGHTNLVEYQTEKINGIYPPATLSYELTTKLLREELGFKGVTVTDALCMGGFAGNRAVENCIKSFLAGNDVLLWPAYEYIDEMERMILSGEIDEELLDKAVERIWNLKKEYGIIDEKDFEFEGNLEKYDNIIREVSGKALTLINNKILPVDKNNIKNVFIVGVTPDDKQYENLLGLKEEFEKYGCKVKMQRNVWTDEIEQTDKYDLILFALCRTTHSPIGPLDFWGEEASSIWASNCSDKSKTVVASFGTPYLYRYYKNSNITYINAYSCIKPTLEAVVKAIFGEIRFEGKSSVKLR